MFSHFWADSGSQFLNLGKSGFPIFQLDLRIKNLP